MIWDGMEWHGSARACVDECLKKPGSITSALVSSSALGCRLASGRKWDGELCCCGGQRHSRPGGLQRTWA